MRSSEETDTHHVITVSAAHPECFRQVRSTKPTLSTSPPFSSRGIVQQSIVDLQTWTQRGSRTCPPRRALPRTELARRLTRWSCLPNTLSSLPRQISRWSWVMFRGQRSFPASSCDSSVVSHLPFDSYLRDEYDRDHSSQSSPMLSVCRPARCTMGNTKVLGKHSPFSCHFAAIKRPSAPQPPQPPQPSHRPPLLPFLVCYGYGLVLTEV